VVQEQADNAGLEAQEQQEPDFVVELHVQNLAEALEDYFLKAGMLIQGDHFEKIFIPLNMEFVSPGLTFLFGATVQPSKLRDPKVHINEDPSMPVDPKKLN